MPRLDFGRLRPHLARVECALPRPALGLLVVLAGTIVGAAAGAAEEGPRAQSPAPPEAVTPPAPHPEPAAEAPPEVAAIPAALLAGLDPLVHGPAVVDGAPRRVAELAGGRRAVLTLDAPLQAHLEAELARFEVPFGAAGRSGAGDPDVCWPTSRTRARIPAPVTSPGTRRHRRLRSSR